MALELSGLCLGRSWPGREEFTMHTTWDIMQTRVPEIKKKKKKSKRYTSPDLGFWKFPTAAGGGEYLSTLGS